jgi:4-hydroxybutyrate dehydrogenase / sulfolactaldehyde 3-reductase
MANVAFIGLGTMGLAMARNIIEGGHRVTGYDTAPDAIANHVANGGSAASSPANAADGAKVIITMLPVGEVVKRVLFDASGVVETAGVASLVIDMSTINPIDTDEIRDGLAAKEIRMIDAPVGRTSEQAKTGNLLIMAGGSAADIEEAQPVFECMGDTVVDCGGPGMGARMKIINNLMSTVLNVLTAEALTLAESSGLDRNLAIEVMSGTAAGLGHMSTTYPAKVLKNDISPAFMIDLAKKDLGIAITLSETLGVPLALAGMAEAVYANAHDEGRGAQDWTALYEMLRQKYIL